MFSHLFLFSICLECTLCLFYKRCKVWSSQATTSSSSLWTFYVFIYTFCICLKMHLWSNEGEGGGDLWQLLCLFSHLSPLLEPWTSHVWFLVASHTPSTKSFQHCDGFVMWNLIYIANSFSQLFHPFTKGDGFFFMFYHEC